MKQRETAVKPASQQDIMNCSKQATWESFYLFLCACGSQLCVMLGRSIIKKSWKALADRNLIFLYFAVINRTLDFCSVCSEDRRCEVMQQHLTYVVVLLIYLSFGELQEIIYKKTNSLCITLHEAQYEKNEQEWQK